MKIFIDNTLIDTDKQTQVNVSVELPMKQQVAQATKSHEQTISLPMTSRNAKIFGYAYEPNGAQMFNNTPHTIQITQRGAIIAAGTVAIRKAVQQKPGRYAKGRFECTMARPYDWTDSAAEKMFNELPITFETIMSAVNIQQSWTWDKPVRFLPVRRDSFLSDRCSTTLIPTIQIIPPENYHPFIHYRTLLEQSVADAGYTLRSEFMHQPLFDSLHVSGNYILRDKMTIAIKEQQDFFAGRFTDKSATANSLGMVFASTLQTTNTVGSIVETANPNELGADGMPVQGVFNTNNCFAKKGGVAMFKPMVESMVAFEYNISYMSDYKILDRHRMKGFDTVKTDDGNTFQYKIPNVFVDCREKLKNRITYTVFVFNHSGGEYQLLIDTLDNQSADMNNLTPSDHSLKPMTTFSTRTAKVAMGATEVILGCELRKRNTQNGQFEAYTEDWAMYEGVVAESGEINIGLIVRSSFIRVLPSRHISIDNIIFMGADPTMKLTLGRNTTVRPVFLPHPANDSRVKFKDLAAHQVRQIKLFEAAQQMFNMKFVTDHLNKCVVAEPQESFYTQSTLDWSDKLDTNKPVEVEELGADEPKQRRYRYADGDGSVARLNSDMQSVYASWVADYTKSTPKKMQVEEFNPMFTASISVGNEFPGGASIKLIQVGDRGQHKDVLSEDLNFPPKIVSYQGVVPLPDGELWGYPSYSNSYPMIAFHDTQKQVSLCFDDRDGVTGLHKFHDRQIKTSNQGRRIRLNLWLTPEDIEPFIDLNQVGGGFRTMFLVKLAGETLRLRLEQITDYDPQAGDSTQCVFIKEN